MDEIGRDRIYTMPFAEMKQIVRRSLTILTRETFLYIEIRPQTTNDPDYVLYEVWNKKKDSRLGEVEVTKFSEQQTDVAFQIEPTIEGDDRAFLDWFVEFFFDKVDDLHKGMGLLQQARRPRNLVEADDPEPPIAPNVKLTKDVDWEKLWNWFYNNAGRKWNVKKIAEYLGIPERTVKRHKTEYDAKYGTSLRKKPGQDVA